VEARFFEQWDHYSWYFLKSLTRVCKLRNILLLDPIERLILADSINVKLTWYNLIKEKIIEKCSDNVLMNDYPHLVFGQPIKDDDLLDSDVEELNSEILTMLEFFCETVLELCLDVPPE
jgi:hypothetical protein